MDEARQEKPEDAWGQSISEERQRELQRYLEVWAAETNQGGRKGPFDKNDPRDALGVRLSGADVYWLAEQSGLDEFGRLTNLHLEGANLFGTQLEGATLRDAHLEEADLGHTHLERANLRDTHLEGADLLGASLDKRTRIHKAVLTGAFLDQITFDNTNLSVVTWRAAPLGDELRARAARDEDGKHKARNTRRDEYRAAVRANLRLAIALQANGLSEEAVYYTYRGQLCRRSALFYEGRIWQWLGSWLLATLAGYGYRPGRAILWYGPSSSVLH